MKELTVFEKHQLKIARDTLKMTALGAALMGGMSRKEAAEVVFKLTGKKVEISPEK